MATNDTVENPTNVQKLEAYAGGYETIGYISIAAGVILILIAPQLRKLMGEEK